MQLNKRMGANGYVYQGSNPGHNIAMLIRLFLNGNERTYGQMQGRI